ncbi:MAG: penicillin-binding protein, family [Firmicutes bacterium]|nr:penicillin-binding protein, family [Bacillota bacterium]
MSSDSTSQRKNNGRKTKVSTLAAIVVIAFIVVIVGAGLGFLTASIKSMPSLKGDLQSAAASQIFDVNGKLITTIHSAENRVPVNINKIPPGLQNAFVAAEDARFYQHMGIDPRGILRAVWSNLTNAEVAEGGSTITQQLAKNALLTQERTLKRKIQEAVLALQIEQKYTKAEILEMYLNQIYFGQGAYGVQSAADIYFGKNVEDLNLAECAMLAGIPKSPNYYSPKSNLKAAKERQVIVLDQMVKYGYITQSEAEKAKKTEIKLANKPHEENTTASYFIDYVTQILIDKYGANAVYKEGLKIYTTLDLDMQKAAENAIKQLPTYRTDANGIKQPQGALIAIDPHNGYIKAMVGGRGNDQFNRTVLAERQPGSAFKLFVYLAAIENGMTPGTVIDDSPISFGDWSPVNYDGRFRGSVTLRTALENSLNVPTVKVTDQVGVDKVLYYAQQLGISTLVLHGATNDRNLAASLGGLTRGVTPLELASAYGAIANGGVKAEPMAIVKVVNRNGTTIEENHSKIRSVINEKSAYILTDMMRGVISRGTGTGAQIGRPAAGKTGTTNDYKDAWFVGFTPDLVAAVWMGCDNDGYLSGIGGGSTPATIWNKFMTAALAGVPAHDFIGPNGVAPSYDSEPDNDPAADSKDKKDDPKKAVKPNPNDKNKAASPTGKPEDKTLPPLPGKSDATDKSAQPALPPVPTRTDEQGKGQ